MATLALTALISILASAFVASLLCRRSARRIAARFEERLSTQRAEDAARHLLERESMATATDQLTRAGYAYIERLRAEIVKLKQQLADGRLAHDAEVAEFRDKLAAVQDEMARQGQAMG